jgi:hypothetical protein
MMIANLTASLLSLPILLGLGIAAGLMRSLGFGTVAIVLVAGVLPNPFTAGLQYLSYLMATQKGNFLSDQWDGLRVFAPVAVRVWLLALAGTAVILANIFFYARSSLPPARFLEIIWLYVLLVWVCVHLYVYPLIVEQNIKRVLLIYRNAFVMTASRPVFTMVAVVAWLGILLISTSTGLVLVIGLALAASIQQNAAATVLPTFRHAEDLSTE